jgi:pyruvate dehydrogenase E1 component alpha subunit
VDGNDALAVYKASKEAVERARAGKGPTLIEAVTFRMAMHTTADDPTRYREESLVKEWEKKDPLIRFKSYLIQKGLWDEERETELKGRLKEKIDQAVKTFEQGVDIKPDAPFDFVFSTRETIIEDQRTRFLENLKKEADHG